MGIRREHIVKTPEHVSGTFSLAQNTSYLVEHIFTQRANTSPTRILAATVWESEHIFKTSSCASAALPRIVRASGSEHHTRRGDGKLSHWQHVARGLPSAARHWWPPSGVPPSTPGGLRLAASHWWPAVAFGPFAVQWRSGLLPCSDLRWLPKCGTASSLLGPAATPFYHRGVVACRASNPLRSPRHYYYDCYF